MKRKKAVDLFDDRVITITTMPNRENPESWRVASARKSFGYFKDFTDAILMAVKHGDVIYLDGEKLASSSH